MKFNVSVSIQESGRNSQKRGYELDPNQDEATTLMELLQFTKMALIITAAEALSEEQSYGFDPAPLTFVDGSSSKSPANVNPLGKIEFVSRQNIDDILIETYGALLYRSKVLTGTYKSSHFVFYNNEQIATDENSLMAWLKVKPEMKDGDTIRFVNIEPYARRLERYGITAQRSNIKQDEQGRRKGKKTGVFFKVPNGTYYLTYRSISRKYKQNINIRFTFLPGSAMGLTDRNQKHHFASRKRHGKYELGRTYLYPTIIFTVNSGGLSDV